MGVLVAMALPSSYLSTCEACILAGGLSSRMGQNKGRLCLGGRTVLGHIRAKAEEFGLPVRIVRRDLVPRCGPVGGIYTALSTSGAESILFLSCDMPFISGALLNKMFARVPATRTALFFETDNGVSFPFWLSLSSLKAVEQQLARQAYSLQALAGVLRARTIRAPPALRDQLFNINTPADWEVARDRWRCRFSSRAAAGPATAD